MNRPAPLPTEQSAASRWERIRDRLAADIAEGRLTPGMQLPTESELCRRFEAGRHSVRRAVGALAEGGQLRVEQGRGTFVESAPLINYTIGRRTRFHQNLLDQGLFPTGELLEEAVIAAPAAVAQALGLAEGDPVHRLLRRGLADGVPINLGLSFYPVALFPDLPERLRAGQSLTAIYRDHGISDYFRKRTVIFSRRPDDEEAALLKQHPGQPVMIVQKTDVDAADRGIGHSQTIWAGDRVQFTLETHEDAAPEEGTTNA